MDLHLVYTLNQDLLSSLRDLSPCLSQIGFHLSWLKSFSTYWAWRLLFLESQFYTRLTKEAGDMVKIIIKDKKVRKMKSEK